MAIPGFHGNGDEKNEHYGHKANRGAARMNAGKAPVSPSATKIIHHATKKAQATGSGIADVSKLTVARNKMIKHLKKGS